MTPQNPSQPGSITPLESIFNPPDLKQIRYRIGDQQLFFERMLECLPLETLKSGPHSNTKPLASLTTRETDDPTIALLYSWACILDVLTFYQERLANEGFLQTAQQRDSLVYLGTLLGFQPSHGLGAEAFLAFSVAEDLSVQQVLVPARTRILSIPGQEEVPQTFETKMPFTAMADWNVMKPRLSLPQNPTANAQQLVLAGAELSLAPGDLLLLVNKGFSADAIDWRIVTLTEVISDSDTETTIAKWAELNPNQTIPLPPLVYRFDTQCFLFGYDAPPWNDLAFEIKRANTPPGMSPQDFKDWPGMDLNLQKFDLDAIYSDILPDSFLLATSPNQISLHWIAQNQTTYADRFSLADQVSQITSAWYKTQPLNNRLIPGRKGHSQTLLKTGLLLIAGGQDQQGQALATTQLFDVNTRIFTPAGVMSQARAFHTVTTLPNGCIVFIGGKGEKGKAVAEAEIYDPETQSFSAGGKMSEGRWDHTATALPELVAFGEDEAPRFAVMVAGGISGRKTFKQVWFYDPENADFAVAMPLQTARVNHTATLLPSQEDRPAMIFIAGGNDQSQVLDSFELYDPTSGSGPLQMLQTGRTLHSATLLIEQKQLILIGGRGDEGSALDTSEIYDETGNYLGSPSNQLHPGRWSHSATLLANGQIFIAGGSFNRDILSDTWLFKPNEELASAHFQSGYPLSWPRTDQTASLVEGQAILSGGMGPEEREILSKNTVLDTIAVLDGDTETFTTAATSLFAASGATATLLPSGYVLLAGGKGHLRNNNPDALKANAPLFLAERYHPETETFSLTGEMTTSRYGHTATLLNNKSVLMAGGNWEANSFGETLGDLVKTIIERIKKALVQIETAFGSLDDIELATTAALEAMDALQTQLHSTLKLVTEIYGKGRMLIVDEPPIISKAFFDLFLKIPEIGDTSQQASLPTLSSEKDLFKFARPLAIPQNQPIELPWDTTLWHLGQVIFQHHLPPIRDAINRIKQDQSQAKDALNQAVNLLNQAIQDLEGMVSFGNQTAEIYDPEPGSFSPTNGPMIYTRYNHTTALLPDGNLLIAGGNGFPTPEGNDDPPEPIPLASAEIYQAGSMDFKVTGSMPQARVFHTATSLGNGLVLMVGGLSDSNQVLDTCLLFNPQTASFGATGSLPKTGVASTLGRYKHAASLLPDGQVMIAGGLNGNHQASADVFLYNPLNGQFKITGTMKSARYSFGNSLLSKRHPGLVLEASQVLVAGGYAGPSDGDPLAEAELYDCETGLFRETGAMPYPKAEYQMMILQDGLVLTPMGSRTMQSENKPTAETLLYHPPVTFQLSQRRETVIQAATQELALAAIPDTTPVSGRGIHLDRFHLPTESGRDAFLKGQPLSYRVAKDKTLFLKTIPYGACQVLETGDLLRQLQCPSLQDDTQLSGPMYQWFMETREGQRGYLDAAMTALEALSFAEHSAEAPEKEPLTELIQIESLTAQKGQPSQLQCLQPLNNAYYRETVVISANVMLATQGETQAEEILGSGDGAIPNQSFPLPSGPLIFLSGSSGPEPALTVFVEQVVWQRVTTFFGQKPDSQVYTLVNTTQNGWLVVFGNGENGARLPTGVDNIIANYRIGQSQQGQVVAHSLTQLENPPLGIESVNNPLPASGGIGQNPDSGLRRLIPLSVANLDRIVSLADYETYAENFPGIFKAQAIAFYQDGIPVLGMTVSIDARGNTDQNAFIEELKNAVFNLQGPFREVNIAPFSPAGFGVQASLIVARGKAVDDMLYVAETTLVAVFNFASDEFGQDIAASDILAVLQNLDGIEGVNLKYLYRSDGMKSLQAKVIATEAHFDANTRIFVPAEILAIDPGAIVLSGRRPVG